MSAILCGERVDEDHVRMIQTPQDTVSYKAVPYGAILDTLQEHIQQSPWQVTKSEYALARDGMQLFGVLNLANKDESLNGIPALDDLRPSIGFRSSHDKSISVGIVTGASVFVCDNMIFSVSGFRSVRKHTRNVFRDFEEIVARSMDNAESQFMGIAGARTEMKQIPVDRDRGYELLGLAYGQGIVTPHQYTSAVNEWRNPTFAGAFEEEDFWSLYNSITFGLKKGAVSEVVKRYTTAHSWATNLMKELDDGTQTGTPQTEQERPAIQLAQLVEQAAEGVGRTYTNPWPESRG